MRSYISFLFIFFVTYSLGQTLVLPGDFPDPSVVQIGDSYWATATTSNWAPAFPLLESKDLTHWKLRSQVFSKLPAWADFYFWAPEISYDNGRVFVYYSAHKRNGNMCVGVASADNPTASFQDHGPLMCQEDGSIDAWPMRDAQGKLFLVWKEDGNSVKLPTSIWAMQMDEGRTRLLGEKKELFRNDASWEANLVEGVSMIRHGDYFYAFYAGAGCCGRACSYGIGVARAKDLLGPWEKYAANPVMTGNDTWKCPGHGTPIVKDGKYYFLYHAYNSESNVYAGRQGLLSEFNFTSDGWINFLSSPDPVNDVIPGEMADPFDSDSLSLNWQWSVFQQPRYKLRGGTLELMGMAEKPGAFLGRKTFGAAYEASVAVLTRSSTAEAGLALAGDEKNFVSVSLIENKMILRKIEAGHETIVKEQKFRHADKLYLRVKVENGEDIIFFYSVDGKKFTRLNDAPIKGFFLPPWDRAVRVALVSLGDRTQKAVFDNFRLKNY